MANKKKCRISNACHFSIQFERRVLMTPIHIAGKRGSLRPFSLNSERGGGGICFFGELENVKNSRLIENCILLISDQIHPYWHCRQER